MLSAISLDSYPFHPFLFFSIGGSLTLSTVPLISFLAASTLSINLSNGSDSVCAEDSA
jgi:hypothetical protein